MKTHADTTFIVFLLPTKQFSLAKYIYKLQTNLGCSEFRLHQQIEIMTMKTTKANPQTRAIPGHEEGFGLLEWTAYFADIKVSKRDKEHKLPSDEKTHCIIYIIFEIWIKSQLHENLVLLLFI